jgi:hypothetical protein
MPVGAVFFLHPVPLYNGRHVSQQTNTSCVHLDAHAVADPLHIRQHTTKQQMAQYGPAGRDSTLLHVH